jgi:hypothetical protein
MLGGPTRENIAEAVFAMLLRVDGFRYVSRRIRMPGPSVGALSDDQLPALFLWGDGPTTYARQPDGMLIRVIEMQAMLFFRAPCPPEDGENWQTGSTVANALLDALEAEVLTPDDNVRNVNTLGGLVDRCWIEGVVHVATGDTDPERLGAARVPIKVRIP